ncbi:MAG: pseudouridine synthase [Acidimicrobiia bacterium]
MSDEPAPAGRLRLQRAISMAGLMSRRAAEELIRAGRITIDGRVAVLGDRVDPSGETVAIDGVPVPVAPGLVTYLLYKPPGVVSTASDPQGRPTVVGLIPSEVRLWPVGRLDVESEGLVLLTNDGELTNLVTHPRHGVPKTYTALVVGRPRAAVLRRLEEGVDLDDGPARALRCRLLDATPEEALVEVVMGEGRKREVRRMFDAVGHPVRRLVRTAIGPIRDPGLRPGAWRPLDVHEVAALYAAGRPRATP